jgi:drug/metabolite transporter (DMT)-like permease
MSVAASSQTLPRTGFVLLVALTLFWGLNWPIMKTAVSEIPPLIFRTFCMGSGAIGLLTLARLGGHSLRVPRKQLGPLVLAAFFNMTVWNIFIAYGIALVPAGRGAILAYTMSLWGVLFGALVLRERLTARRVFGLAAGLAGMAVLMGGDLATLMDSPRGTLLIIGAAASWGAGTVIVKRARFTIPVTSMAGWQLLIGGLPVFIAALMFDWGAIGPVGLAPILGTAYNMFICFIFCYWAWFRIVGMVPVAVAGLSTLMIPVVGVFSGAWLLGEAIGVPELMSLALVVTALAAVLNPVGDAKPRATG